MQTSPSVSDACHLGKQALGLDDLEDILNTPSPALDSSAAILRWPSSANLAQASSHAVENSTAGSLTASAQVAKQDPVDQLQKSASSTVAASRLSSICSTAYQSASAPIAAAWARVPEQLHRLQPQKVAQLCYLPTEQEHNPVCLNMLVLL